MTMQREAFRLSHSLRVRWSEVDMQGIVFNGHYLTYADIGITEYFRALTASCGGDTGAKGGDFFAVRTLLEYRAPAENDDLLDVHVRIGRLGNSSMLFIIAIYRGDTLLLTGEITYGRIPAGSVVVSGNLPSKDGKYSLYCAVIVKRVDEKTRSKVGINELLRDI